LCANQLTALPSEIACLSNLTVLGDCVVVAVRGT